MNVHQGCRVKVKFISFCIVFIFLIIVRAKLFFLYLNDYSIFIYGI